MENLWQYVDTDEESGESFTCVPFMEDCTCAVYCQCSWGQTMCLVIETMEYPRRHPGNEDIAKVSFQIGFNDSNSQLTMQCPAW